MRVISNKELASMPEWTLFVIENPESDSYPFIFNYTTSYLDALKEIKYRELSVYDSQLTIIKNDISLDRNDNRIYTIFELEDLKELRDIINRAIEKY